MAAMTSERLIRSSVKKDFLTIGDLSNDDVAQIVAVARHLKEDRRNTAFSPLQGRHLALVFQKPSLRTRVSFEVAMAELGGRTTYLSPEEVGLGKRETVEDVARVLSRYVDVIVARVFAQSEVEKLAANATVPVVNGLSDHDHPCQALADVLTICERCPDPRALTLAWVGDGNNVFHSLVEATVALGINVRAAIPRGYECDPVVLQRAHVRASLSGATISVGTDPREAVRGADVIYTDVWTSMGQEAERAARMRAFAGYQVNTELVALAAPDVFVMHDLPAHRGEEITADVIDGPRSVVFDQAENRLHAQKAVLYSLLG